MTQASAASEDGVSKDRKGDINPIFRRKAIYPMQEDPWVEVLAKSNNSLLPEAPFSFHLSEVVGIRGLAPEYSALELKNGGEYLFKLPHAALSDKIYSADVAVIDLKDFSVVKDKKVLMKEILRQAVKEGRISMGAITWKVGEFVEGEGIYLGKYELPASSGAKLTNVFNVFAAPKDLGEGASYENSIALVAGLKDWCDHDGEYYADAKALLKALDNESYKGGWVVPPREILAGVAEKAVDNLYACRKIGAFAGSLQPSWYWSSTRDPSNAGNVLIKLFDDSGSEQFYNSTGVNLYTRPIRLVPSF